jgi:hypothetical protein
MPVSAADTRLPNSWASNDGTRAVHKAMKNESDYISRSGPIRHGSVLYRALEIVAAEIIRHPRGVGSTKAPRTNGSRPEDEATQEDTD